MFILQSAIVFVMVIATLFFTLTALQKIFAMVNSGQPEMLTDKSQMRAKSVLQMVFGEKKVMDDKKYGFMHLWYLYGFLILSIGHMELVFFGLTRFAENFGFRPFLYRNLPFVPDFVIHFYEFSQDFFAGGVLIVVSIALYKRLSGKVKRLMPRSIDAEIILWFIGFLYLTFFTTISDFLCFTNK